MYMYVLQCTSHHYILQFLNVHVLIYPQHPYMYSVHSTPSTLTCTVYTLPPAPLHVQCTLYPQHPYMYSVHSTPSTLTCTVYTLPPAPLHVHSTPSTLENYAMWQLIYQYIPYLDQRFLGAYAVYSGVVGLSVQPQRYTTCIGVAQDIMPMALARPYTDFVLPAGTKVINLHVAWY